MERTVPQTGSDAIELYIRTYYSLLRTSGEIAIETLVESHIGMDSLLHAHAELSQPDIDALIYSSLRLPDCITETDLVILGQRREVFERSGFPIETWQEVSAPARRRRSYYDGEHQTAVYITSRSDIDDIIPLLTAYQIEWNKIHRLLAVPQASALLEQIDYPLNEEELETLAAALGVGLADIERLQSAWGAGMLDTLRVIASKSKRFYLNLLASSLADYRKATRQWWLNVRAQSSDLDFENSRVYFISSNTHSLVNLWSGYALRQREILRDYLEAAGHADLLHEYQDIEANSIPSSRENFLYYVLKKYLNDTGPEAYAKRHAEEVAVGIHRVSSAHSFDLDSQVFELSKANADWLDPRLRLDEVEDLKASKALVFNIDYPLGMGAYEILTRFFENVGEIAGIYIMGKAATLNGRVGDVMIPTVVHDEHSQNTYMFDNCFRATDVAPYLAYGTVLDNQKSVTVRGTFLQNTRYMSVFYREGYTDIEMEAGPYLSAAYELWRPKRHPYNEIISLHPAHDFDLGMIHYASDKPLSKGQNLGAGSLSYRGMDPTYAASVAIWRHIIRQELKLIHEQQEIPV